MIQLYPRVTATRLQRCVQLLPRHRQGVSLPAVSSRICCGRTRDISRLARSMAGSSLAQQQQRLWPVTVAKSSMTIGGEGGSTGRSKIVLSNTLQNHQILRWNSTDDDSRKVTTEEEGEQQKKQQQPPGTATITFSEKDDSEDIDEMKTANVTTDPTSTVEEDTPSSKFTVVVPIRMPDMGEGENKIVTWYKRPGDLIQRNDILCDIQTPDFTFGMVTEDEHDALMGEIFFEENAEEAIPDETVICHILHQEHPGNA